VYRMSITKLKNLIISNKGYKCEICNIRDWNSNKICLEIDHIDGNNQNNLLENLRLLCPNCHSQTSTFRGKNIKSKQQISDEILYEALISTDNIRQALIKVGMTPKGENYKRAYKLLYGSYEPLIAKNNSQYGTCWINNGSCNKKIKKNILQEYENLGWKLGRLLPSFIPPSQKGKFWVTNGAINKMVFETPERFWKGKIQN